MLTGRGITKCSATFWYSENEPSPITATNAPFGSFTFSPFATMTPRLFFFKKKKNK